MGGGAGAAGEIGHLLTFALTFFPHDYRSSRTIIDVRVLQRRACVPTTDPATHTKSSRGKHVLSAGASYLLYLPAETVQRANETFVFSLIPGGAVRRPVLPDAS